MLDLVLSVSILIVFVATVFSLALIPICVHWYREKDQHLLDLERGEVTRSPHDDERIVTSRNNGCVICLENFQEGEDCQAISLCKHVFHSGCLKEWLVQNQTCPLCRLPVLLEVFLYICRVRLIIQWVLFFSLVNQHESFM
ncbi:hypothetical protein NC651_025789 [Populus alba x Populus x berolinensis]|nr:hypothetical protein NC651_025789 [Populus alba x Populus x berolinensis]